jgi:hypothetical protein
MIISPLFYKIVIANKYDYVLVIRKYLLCSYQFVDLAITII